MCVCVCVCVCVCFVLFFVFFSTPCGKFGSLYLGKAQQPQEQRYPFLSVCVQCFRVSKQWYGCQIWDLGIWDWDWDFGIRNVRTRLIAGAVYGNSESLHWKLTLGEKSLVAPGNRTRVRIFASGFSVGRFTN